MASIAYEPSAPGVDTKPVDVDSVTAWFLKVVIWLFVSIEVDSLDVAPSTHHRLL